MNARTPSDLTGEPTELTIFDFTRWKPLTAERYVDLFGEIPFALPEGQHVVSQVEDMPNGDLRIVTWANVQYLKGARQTAHEPYLVMIHDVERKKAALLMMRTDVQLHKDNLILS